TITIADNRDANDNTFVVDAHGLGELHSIINAGDLNSLTLVLAGGTNNVTVDALDAAFHGSLTVEGHAGDDTVTFLEKTGGGTYTFTGGGGDDTIVGPDLNNNWTITGADAGSLNGAFGYSGVENLTGGAGNDNFAVSAGGSVSGTIDGGESSSPTLDVIDLS